MQINTRNEGGVATLTLSGNFTFDCHRDFKDATMAAIQSPGFKKLVLDFAAVEYLDSSGLGMLLLLKERAGSADVLLQNCSGTVRNVLEIANFNKIFDLK